MNDDSKLTRREREKLTHRTEIIDAAERVFVKNGFLRSTMEEVAAEAEFSVGAIYKHFEGKEKLCVQVIENIIQECISEFKSEIMAMEKPLDALYEVVVLRLRHAKRHGKFFRLLINLDSSVMPEIAIPERCRGFYDEYLEDVATLFNKAMEDGLIVTMNPLSGAIGMDGIISAFVAFWDRHNTKISIEEKTRTIQDNFLKHILIDTKKDK